MKALNGFLITKVDELDRRMWVYNVRKLHRPRMSDVFFANTVDAI